MRRAPTILSTPSYRTAGATLLEVLAVLGILALLLAEPLWSSRVVPQLLRSEAELLASTFRHSRIRAQRGSTNLGVECAPDRIVVGGVSGAPRQIRRLPASVRVQSAVFGSLASEPHVAQFWPNATQSPGTVVLEGSKHSRCIITLALRGAVRVRCLRER